MTDIKRQARRQSKQSTEWGRGKSLAAVKQEKSSARVKIAGRESSCNGTRYLPSSARARFSPSHAVYCYLTVLYSFCKDGLQLLQSDKVHFSSSKKKHWNCSFCSALTDFQRTVNAILQCRPHLKALGSELELSKKMYKSSRVKILVNSFAPLA